MTFSSYIYEKEKRDSLLVTSCSSSKLGTTEFRVGWVEADALKLGSNQLDEAS